MTLPARQELVAVYGATVPTDLDWTVGPFPFSHDGIRADSAGRATYYPPRTAHLLYGTSDRPCRWHKPVQQPIGDGVTVLGLEALRVHGYPGVDGLVIVHLQCSSRVVDTARSLAGRTAAQLDGYDPHQLTGESIELSAAPPFTLCLVTPAGRRLPRLFSPMHHPRWPSADQWLWALASRTNRRDYPPDRDAPQEQRIRFSADWRSLVLRDGAALAGTRRDTGPSDPFYNHAALYTRTLYLDALLLGLLQLQGLTALEERLALAFDDPAAITMVDLELQVTQFRHRLWWQHLSTHGAPNRLLAAFHRQHQMQERFDQILAEVNDFNRISREGENRLVNSAIVLFTLITVPTSIALALLQVLDSRDPWLFVAVLAVCMVVVGLLLLTRPARTVLRAIRSRH